MREIKIKDTTIELEKDYLTNGEVNYIVEEICKDYIESGKGIKGYLNILTNFNTFLFGLCIKNYNFDNSDDYEKYYNLGVHEVLINEVTNAKNALDTIMILYKELNNINSAVQSFFDKVLILLNQKIPDGKKLEDIANSIPDEWKNVFSQYQNIIGKDEEDK